MNKDFFRILFNLLKTNTEFMSNENTLLKNKVYESAMRMDNNLIDLLFNNEVTREFFFKKTNSSYVFDKMEFAWLINNREFIPNNFTKFSQNIGLFTTNNKDFLGKDDVVLNFPYKDCLLEFNSSDENCQEDELFYNETLSRKEIDVLLEPKVFTNIKSYGNANINFSDNDNLIINGNNLLALSSLLPRYRERIKCIYWDVLYNTNGDYVPYNDSFKHSSWLVMMKNRLEVAKELLAPDGLIFINIDDNEQSYLSVLMDEIFGRDNSFDKIAIQTSASQGGFGDVNPGLISNTEYLLAYVKDNLYKKSCFNEENMYIKKDYDENYKYIMTDMDNLKYVNINDLAYEKLNIEKPYDNNTWRKVKEKFGESYKEILYKVKSEIAYDFKEKVFRTFNPNKPSNALKSKLNESLEKKGVIIIDKDSNGDNRYILNGEIVLFYKKIFKNIDGEDVPTRRLTTFWDDIAWEGIAKEGNVKLRNGKKPEKLLKRIIEISTKPGDIVLDAYLGSGTTAAVAHKLNRQYIGIEQLDSHFNKAIDRMSGVINGDTTGISSQIAWIGGGSFKSMTLMDNNNQYVNKIKKLSTDEEIINMYNTLKKSAYLNYNVDISKFDENIDEFILLTLDEKKEILLRILDKNMMYINYSEINDENNKISEVDKQFNNDFYEVE